MHWLTELYDRLYYGVTLLTYVTELYYGIISQKHSEEHIMELGYGFILPNYITELHYEIVLWNHITELYYGVMLKKNPH